MTQRKNELRYAIDETVEKLTDLSFILDSNGLDEVMDELEAHVDRARDAAFAAEEIAHNVIINNQ